MRNRNFVLHQVSLGLWDGGQKSVRTQLADEKVYKIMARKHEGKK